MPIQVGTYVSPTVRLVRPLGKGGMGAVWVACNVALDAEVAVKFVSAQLAAEDPTVIPRFTREAALSAKIKSPHVVKTFDHGVMEDGHPYIVMEMLEGETLGDRLEKVTRLAPHEVATIITQVAQVLAEAHQLGIVHRDIKPDNIFMLDSAYDLFVKVLDFGIAKQTTKGVSNVTTTGTIVGTPEYMSPEQLLSTKSADHRADMWSLAVVAYHCLTGEVPFKGETLPSLSIVICAGRYLPASEALPSLGTYFDEFFARCFDIEADKRFANVLEMAESFRNVVRNVAYEQSGPIGISSDIISGAANTPPISPRSGTQVSASPAPGVGPTPPHIAVEGARPDSGIRQWLQQAGPDESGRRMATGEQVSPTISGAVSAFEPPKAERRGTWWKVTAALAAAALLVIGGGFALHLGAATGTESSVAAAAEADDTPSEPTAEPAASPQPEPQATASASASLEEEAAASASASDSATAAPVSQHVAQPTQQNPFAGTNHKTGARNGTKGGDSKGGTTKPNCASPYVTMPDGSLKVRPECL